MTRLSSKIEPEQNNSQGLRNGHTRGGPGGPDKIGPPGWMACEKDPEKKYSFACEECIDLNECMTD